VREDYSPHGTAWDAFPHDHARSRAYRWGEDGLAGWSDDRQLLCLSLALWNGEDPILKERLFGLANAEGNHGEDVKEVYHYLDATPTHSYLRFLYRYPQRAYPYSDLVEENRRRGRDQPEYELADTGVLDENRYFDVVVEYAKHDVDDTLMRISVVNRGPQAASLHVLPQLLFRNIWSWRPDPPPRPILAAAPSEGPGVIRGEHIWLGTIRCAITADTAISTELLFCENETNPVRHHGASPGTSGVFKDAFHEHVVRGQPGVLGNGHGTKAAAHIRLELRPACVSRLPSAIRTLPPARWPLRPRQSLPTLQHSMPSWIGDVRRLTSSMTMFNAASLTPTLASCSVKRSPV
jgi:hypothetical protein